MTAPQVSAEQAREAAVAISNAVTIITPPLAEHCKTLVTFIAQQAAPPSGSVGEDVVERVEKAMRRAFDLGQRYWQDADSESYKANKRADEWREKFRRLNDETLAALTAAAVAAPAGDGGEGHWMLLRPERDTAQAGDEVLSQDGEWCAVWPQEVGTEIGLGSPPMRRWYSTKAMHAAPAGVSPSAAQDGTCRESLGKIVRAVWIAWAREQPNPKPSWLLPWDELAEPDREVDRRIGETLFRIGRTATPEAAQEGGKAVAWQTRWKRADGSWEPWHPCSEESYTHIAEGIQQDRWAMKYEVRALYTTPQDDRPAREGDAP